MNPKLKKILKITAVILAIIFVGLLVYYWFFKKPPTAPAPATPEEFPVIQEGAPEAVKTRLIALTNETVLAGSLTGDDKIIYVAWDGSLTQMNTDGTGKEKIAALPQERTGEISFSQNGQKVVIRQTLSSGASRYLIYDIVSKSVKGLPASTETAALSPDGSQIITSAPSGGVHQLVLNNSDLTKTQKLITTKIPDLALAWDNKDSLILKTKPSGLSYGILYALNLKTKKLQRILGNLYGLTASFSPSGQKILYSQTEADGSSLKLVYLNSAKKFNLDLDILSLPEKCAWAQDDRTVYCDSLNDPGDFVMPDDYYKRKLPAANTDIIKINLDLNQTQKIISGGFDAVNLMLSAEEKYLFFINKIDGRMYRLTL